MQDIEDKERYINTGRLIHILSNQMKRRNASEAVGDDGLTTMQKHVLKHILLETMHREVYQKDIEEEFQIRKSTATGILQLMEKNGFISRESSKKDARLKRIVPTPKAEALRPEILEHIRDTEKRLIQGIDQEDVKICRKVLVQMIQNLAENKKKIRRKTRTMNKTLLKSVRELQKAVCVGSIFRNPGSFNGSSDSDGDGEDH